MANESSPHSSEISAQLALSRLIEHREIFYDEMLQLMRKIMTGDISPIMTAAIITALRVKKETVGEITAAAKVLREFATHVTVKEPTQLVDIVGTGGDGLHTFNISTCAMFVAAGAGVLVSKHGGRSVSSKCGSADVLEKLGVNIHLSTEQIAQCINEIGIGFMFAPNHHFATKNVSPIRKELGVKTIFNILGPLTNPSQAGRALIGVFHPDLVGIMIRTLANLGLTRALVVHGQDGLDELSLEAPTWVGELNQGVISEYVIHPKDMGLPGFTHSQFTVNDAQESKKIILSVLNNESSNALEIVALNAGAAIYLSGKVNSIKEGIQLAKQSIQNGAALQKLNDLIRLSNTLPHPSL